MRNLFDIVAKAIGCGTFVTALAASPGVAQDAEIVRGRVMGPLDVGIPNAVVTITGAQTQAVRLTRTDSNGVYAALFATGEREYTIAVRALGYAPRTVSVARGDAGLSFLVADVRLSFVDFTVGALQLDTVRIAAQRGSAVPVPARADPFGRGAGATDRDATRGGLFTLDPSDILAIALSVPGVLPVLDARGDTTGFSVLGARPEQNSTVVDGSSFGGRTLPRDAIANIRLATTTFDPGRGGFSGGQVSATTRGGTDVFQATGRATAADPRLSYSDPASPTPAPRVRSISGSVGGPIRPRRAHYFAAVEGRTNDTQMYSLLAPRLADLAQLGVAPDSVSTVRSGLAALGVPVTTRRIPGHRGDDRTTAFLRMDFIPAATSALTLRLDGSARERSGQGISTLTFPSLATRARTTRAGLQVSASTVFRRRFLDELQSYVERARTSVDPYVELPAGVVRVSSRHPDGRTGLTSLQFGGPLGQTASENTRWETRNELSWLSTGTQHRVKLGQSFTLERAAQSEETGRFGTYSYASIDDLLANRPASYARRFSSRALTSGTVIGALWGGDEWRVTNTLRVQYGARLDAIRPTNAPAYNPAVDSLFGARTDRLPTDVGVSPRAGLSWTPRARDLAAFVSRRRRDVQAITISGGLGAFRGVIPPARLASLFDATGLSTNAQHLECVGGATPIPDWTSTAGAVPASCTDGAAPVEYATAQPNVATFDREFGAPVSWRAAANVERVRVFGWMMGVNATYSLGVNGESAVDLNVRRTPVFTIAEEQRPVFSSPGSIVLATGAVAPGAPRLTSRFVRATSYLSDLRSRAMELRLTLVPPRPIAGRYPVSASYTWSRQRAQQRGFGSAAGLSPFEKEWSRGSQPAHEILVNASGRVWWLAVAARLNVTSGLAYTPTVVGDVNGDGAPGDRAFVFDADAVSDAELAAQMRALVASAPAGARECLLSQRGRIAARNSCNTGWQLRPDVNLELVPPSRFGLGDRLRFSATLLNASGALFHVLGLSSQPLARYASQSPPNPTLLYVTGFDSTARRFMYRVNQQFGEQRDVPSGARRFSSPFQIQIGAELQLGGPPRDAMVRSLGLVPAGGAAPLTVPQVRARLRRFANNPVTLVLERRDTLGLSGDQVTALEGVSARFTSRADSLVTPLAGFVVQRGRRLTDVELQRRLSQLATALRPHADVAVREVRTILSEAQVRQLPARFLSQP